MDRSEECIYRCDVTTIDSLFDARATCEDYFCTLLCLNNWDQWRVFKMFIYEVGFSRLCDLSLVGQDHVCLLLDLMRLSNDFGNRMKYCKVTLHDLVWQRLKNRSIFSAPFSVGSGLWRENQGSAVPWLWRGGLMLTSVWTKEIDRTTLSSRY